MRLTNLRGVALGAPGPGGQNGEAHHEKRAQNPPPAAAAVA